MTQVASRFPDQVMMRRARAIRAAPPRSRWISNDLKRPCQRPAGALPGSWLLLLDRSRAIATHQFPVPLVMGPNRGGSATPLLPLLRPVRCR